MDKKKKLILISVVGGIILLIGVTYALYRLLLFDDLSYDTHTNELEEYIVYSKGVDIDGGELTLASSYEEGTNATIDFYKVDDTYDIYGHIYLTINDIGDNLRMYKGLKYTIVDSNDSIISEGSFYETYSGEELLVAPNIYLESTATSYTVYVWIDGDVSIPEDLDLTDEEFSITIRCEATMKEINYLGNGIKYITNLYNNANKTAKEQSGANMTYNYANIYGTYGGLMNDRLGSMDIEVDGGNIRYYGSNPNNYIYFNCQDYNVQTNINNCELWRIIGVVDGRLKIIRNSSIGNYSWDSSVSSVNGGYGINQWGESGSYEGADLMKLLNPGYDDNTIDGTSTLVNNSLYYNRQSGKCFNGTKNSYANCDFTTSGITTATKDNNLIADATWYLGAIDTNNIYANEAYTSERGTDVVVPGTTCSGTYCNDTITRTTSWTGKGALMYLSDYGYAADLTKCGMLSAYNSTTNSYECRKNDWLFLSNKYQWTINARLAGAYSVWRVYNDGSASNASASGSDAVRPVYYLNSSAILASGDGSQNNPYQILVG